MFNWCGLTITSRCWLHNFSSLLALVRSKSITYSYSLTSYCSENPIYYFRTCAVTFSPGQWRWSNCRLWAVVVPPSSWIPIHSCRPCWITASICSTTVQFHLWIWRWMASHGLSLQNCTTSWCRRRNFLVSVILTTWYWLVGQLYLLF